jgi:urease accessory protein
LVELMPLVDSTVTAAVNVEDEDIGSGLPRLAMASMQHEVQYSRLFRY